MFLKVGQEIKFKSDHGQTLIGVIQDFNENAIVVVSSIGLIFSINHSQVIPDRSYDDLGGWTVDDLSLDYWDDGAD